jgi:uncharacterized membrane protein
MCIGIEWMIIWITMFVAYGYAREDFKNTGMGAGMYGAFIMGVATIISLIVYIISLKIQ